MTTPEERAERAFPHYLHMHRGINLSMIDATIKAAKDSGQIAPERIERADYARAQCLSLFIAAEGKETQSAEFQRAMDAGQTLFHVAQQLFDLMQLQLPVTRDHATQRQREDAGFTSGDKRTQARASEWDKWQRAANAIYAKNPRKTDTAICNEVGARFKVTGRAVSKRVQIDRTK